MYTKNSDHLLFQLLSVLSDGKIHTYKTLSSHLNCSALVLLKLICDTSRYGIEIGLINGIGICWNKPFIWIDEVSIKSHLNTQSKLFNIVTFDFLDSTNDYLIRNKSSFSGSACRPVVVAELQTKGRGRHKRHWFSNLGGSLTFSILWEFKRDVQYFSALSLVLGVCLVRVFQQLSLKDICLKWPNDILYRNKKFAGILTECKTHNHTITAIIGIGINFNLSSNLMNLIDYSVTDLFEISGKQYDRNYILALLLVELHAVLGVFEIYGFSVFRDEWESYHAFHGQEVTLHFPDKSCISGIIDGVQDNGSLVLTTASEQRVIDIGEIRLRADSQNVCHTRN